MEGRDAHHYTTLALFLVFVSGGQEGGRTLATNFPIFIIRMACNPPTLLALNVCYLVLRLGVEPSLTGLLPLGCNPDVRTVTLAEHLVSYLFDYVSYPCYPCYLNSFSNPTTTK